MTTGEMIQTTSLVLVAVTLVGAILQLREFLKQTGILASNVSQSAIASLAQAPWLSRVAFFLAEPELLKWHLGTSACSLTMPS
jgi:hypothetical protein